MCAVPIPTPLTDRSPLPIQAILSPVGARPRHAGHLEFCGRMIRDGYVTLALPEEFVVLSFNLLLMFSYYRAMASIYKMRSEYMAFMECTTPAERRKMVYITE